METFLIAVRRVLYALSDAVVWPFRTLARLYAGAGRGRAFVLGLPALVVFLVVSTALGFAQFRDDESLNQTYRKSAEDAIAREDWSEAMLMYQKLIGMNPTDQQIKFQLMQLALTLPPPHNNPELARSLLAELAPEDGAGYAPAHIVKATRILQRAEIPYVTRVSVAKKQLELALQADPDDQDAKVLLADLLHEEGDMAGAEELYNDVIVDYPGVAFGLLQIYRQTNRMEMIDPLMRETAARYGELVKRYPEDSALWQRLAMTFIVRRQPEQAIKELQRGIDTVEGEEFDSSLIRTQAVFYLQWAGSLVPQSREDVATFRRQLELLKTALQLDPSNEDVKFAVARLGLDESPIAMEARQVYDPQADIANTSGRILKMLGTAALSRDNVEEGIAFLESAIEKSPDDHEALNNLAFFVMKTDANRALELSNKALELLPATNATARLRARYLDTRAHIYMELGDFSKAAADFEKALPLMPDRRKVHEALVKCYTNLGLTAQAETHQRLMESLPETPDDQGKSP
jgi:tetratricopeptide (TPR) repeat protein